MHMSMATDHDRDCTIESFNCSLTVMLHRYAYDTSANWCVDTHFFSFTLQGRSFHLHFELTVISRCKHVGVSEELAHLLGQVHHCIGPFHGQGLFRRALFYYTVIREDHSVVVRSDTV